MLDKVQWLIDVEEIRQLKYRYCAACDDGYDPETLASFFTEDAIWDGGGLGKAAGKQGIIDFFKSVGGLVQFAIHNVSNPIITIDGDNASGQWNLWQPMVYSEGDEAVWYAAQYNDDYRRTAAGWKISHLRLNNQMHAPYEKGFGVQRFTDEAIK